MKLLVTSLVLSLIPMTALGHARLKTPVPRNNSAGLKAGPCGGIARTATPTVLTAGSTITVTWEETIQHPGRYIFSFSPANDANFAANQLAVVIDTQDNRNDLPHQYTAQVTLPNTPCDSCTFQMIQSMEENPANPSYYYSCADIRLVAATSEEPGPGDGEVAGQDGAKSLADSEKPKFGGGCGTVSGAPPASSGPLSLVVILLLPLLFALRVRKYSH